MDSNTVLGDYMKVKAATGNLEELTGESLEIVKCSFHPLIREFHGNRFC